VPTDASYPTIERLTAEDQLMLWPDEIWPQDIGAVAVLEGSNLLDPDGRFRIEVVKELIGSRLHPVPRFRQLLYVPPRQLGAPLWVDAPAFDLAEHLRVLPLLAPGDEVQLLRAVEQLRRRRMDRSRPLWEMWFLTGLPERRVGLFMRTHHCIADGIAGVATMGAFLDATPDATPVSAPPWIPAPLPSATELRADSRRRRSEELGRRLSGLAHPVSNVQHMLAAWPAMREILAETGFPPTSLDRIVGPDRNLALIRASMEQIREAAHSHDAKVNDVLLTVIAGGLRALLRSRGEPVDDVVLRVYVPVSLRHGQYAQARGNQIAQMVVPLPIGVADPASRLQEIAEETAKRKARSRPSLGKLPHRGIAGRAFLKVVDQQRVNVTTADLPGPEIPLYLAGARLLELFPLLPLIGKVSLGVGAISYAGQFNITAVADRDACPAIDVFVAGVRNELRALSASMTTDPWIQLTSKSGSGAD
jgi:diacylglycerol O-acyltransferase / wax synthase